MLGLMALGLGFWGFSLKVVKGSTEIIKGSYKNADFGDLGLSILSFLSSQNGPTVDGAT